ncbi:MAG: hypothetical protein J6Y58_01720 [Clostridiales bacterium]|nr:hypothetical protein [Clostridiales bacterium]
MKRSYWIYSAILLLLVIVMIVAGVIQDRRMKKSKLRDSAVETLVAAGCEQVDESYVPNKYDVKDVPSDEEVDFSALQNIKTVLTTSSSGSNSDGQMLFNLIGASVLKNAKFYISGTKVSGRDAVVKVHLFYNDNTEGDMELEYFYYDGEWCLSNTFDALKNIRVNGNDYDEAAGSAYNDIVNEMNKVLS